MGDPAGIGPEIAVRLARAVAAGKTSPAEILLYGSSDIIGEAARRFTPDFLPQTIPCSELKFSQMHPGCLDARCGLAALECFRTATLDAIAGKVDAIVTCPINKAAVNLAGIPFTGHTELLASLCGVRDFVMMQSAGDLRVVFVTTHIPLAQVPSDVTFNRIVTVTHLLRDAIVSEGIVHPKIAVAALNPHAGENGNMGREDEEVVKPAIRALEAEGIRIQGPFPPDTLFIENIRTQFDGIVSMYHDQGHIPFKMLAFDRGVNSTLGLPVIRTSVDHGTAFEIAWKGTASVGSLTAAFELARKRAATRIANA
jgi:4-hydroxythreonine-4-phosphate dehydrogenase